MAGVLRALEDRATGKHLSISRYLDYSNKVVKAALGKISFTGDIWSDQCLQPFFAITAHWIARNGQTEHLELRAALVAFHCIVGKHDGKNLAKIALSMLDRAGITVKVYIMSSHP